MGHQQSSIFEFLYDEYKITKPIRLIELFSGIGAQAKALEVLGADFKSWKTCDWAVPSIHAYAAIHGPTDPIHNLDFIFTRPKSSKIELMLQGVSANYDSPMTSQQLAKKSEEWVDSLIRSIIDTNNMVDVMQADADALEMFDYYDYTYVMTYSFPCQDLSLAGNKKGMSVSQADGGTRSGLLWEVERILIECAENKTLPHVLIMENVPEVVGQKNIKDFQKWRARLESFGYSNYCEILNAKDYGIPQNRRRCFMVSILGEYSFTFPRKMKLDRVLQDFLETTIDPKYICNQKMVDYLTGINQKESKYDRAEVFGRNLDPDKKVAATITTRAGMRPTDNYIPIRNNNAKGFEYAFEGDGIDISTRMHHHRGTVQKQSCQTLTTMGGENVGVVVNLKGELCDRLIQEGRVHEGDVVRHSYSSSRMKGLDKDNDRLESQEGLSPTLTTRADTLGVVVKAPGISLADNDLLIKKLTPLECMKLMGFEEKDYLALRDIGQTDAQIYHEAGDSIVTTVLMAIFGQLLGIDYEPIIEKYVDSLVSCNSGCKVQ